MIQFLKYGSLISILFIGIVSCTSVETSDEEQMVNMDQEVGEVASEGLEDSGELGSEDFAEDFGDAEFDAAPTEPQAGTDEFSDAEFGVAGTADEFEDFDFGEESFDDTALNEDFQAPPGEEVDAGFEDFEPAAPSQDEFTGALDAVEEPVAAEPAPPIEAPFAEPVTPIQDNTGWANITDIRFLSAEGGTLVIEGDAPLNYETRLNKDTNQFVVEIPGAQLPSRLLRPYLLKDFSNTPFASVNSYQKGSTARVVVQLRGPAEEPQVLAEGNTLRVGGSGSAVAKASVVDPLPPSSSPDLNGLALSARTLDEFLLNNSKFYGHPINIQLKDADIQDVLNFIADESGANLVVSEEVKGKVTIKLRQVPWDQALVTIMRANKLGYIRSGSVIRIGALKDLQEETNTTRSIIESQKALAPLKVKVIPVSFGNVTEMVEQLGPFLTPERGSIVADPRTSSLIVTDQDEVIERVSRLIKELDIAPAQVMIEGKVVEAGEEFTSTVGVNWGFDGADLDLGSGKYGNIALTPSMDLETVASDALNADVFRFGVNIGTLDLLGDLNATLALAERDNLVKIISSPRIATMNKSQAEIRQEGEQISLSSIVDETGNVTRGVQRTPIVVKLLVTPQVTSDANVILDVEVEREFAGPVLDPVTLAQAVNSRKAKTKILVKNGQTAVIGGIYQSDLTETVSGVPGLKDIPVLGWLFKSKRKDTAKNELLIFLTPRILN